jgi:hypothetical protein
MAIPVPSLSSAGWVTAPADKADLIMAHFFEAEKSQTFLYGDNVTSLQWLVEQFGNNPTSMTQELRDALNVYLNRYYTGVIVNINVVDDGTPRYELRVFIQVTEDGKQYSFGKLLQVTNSKISKIISLNNDGSI